MDAFDRQREAYYNTKRGQDELGSGVGDGVADWMGKANSWLHKVLPVDPVVERSTTGQVIQNVARNTPVLAAALATRNPYLVSALGWSQNYEANFEELVRQLQREGNSEDDARRKAHQAAFWAATLEQPFEYFADMAPVKAARDVLEEEMRCELMEHLIIRVWADVMAGEPNAAQLKSSIAEFIDQRMGPVFAKLGAERQLNDEFMDLRYRYLRNLMECGVPFRRFDWLAQNGWPLRYVFELLERMEEIRAAGELDPALLRPIYAELLHWCPRILARFEELAAEPGPTSQRLAAAITTMRARIPRLQQLQAAAA